MKKTLVFIVVIALLSNCAYTLKHYEVYDRREIIVVKEEIGEVIDVDERSKYDLFDNVEGFQEARFYAITDGGYEVEIVTDRGKYVAVNRDLKAIQILKDYFYRYDEISYNQKAFENRWKIIDYDTLGFAISQQEVDSHTKMTCCIGSSAGCGIGALGVSFLYAWGYALDHMYYDPAVDQTCVAIIFGGTIVGFVIGSLFGRKMDRDRAIDAIGEARMPRMVD